jgi:predicted RNA binding protein YcfA (HicA-like mRNA interferase family)
MKLPRNMSGDELARVLRKHGYEITRQTGSHMRLTSSLQGPEHHITIPRHNPLKVGTMSGILKDVAVYHKLVYQQLVDDLFK